MVLQIGWHVSQCSSASKPTQCPLMCLLECPDHRIMLELEMQEIESFSILPWLYNFLKFNPCPLNYIIKDKAFFLWFGGHSWQWAQGSFLILCLGSAESMASSLTAVLSF